MTPHQPEKTPRHQVNERPGQFDLFRRALVRMTRSCDLRAVLLKAVAAASAAVLVTIPYFRYLTANVIQSQNSGGQFQYDSLLYSQLFLLFIACLLSALVGFSFSQRLGLPGLGDWSGLVGSFWNLLALGILITIASYFLADRYIIKIAPQVYPKNLLYLLAMPFKRAFIDEIILRLGLVTISVMLFKSKPFGVIAVSVLFPFLSVKHFEFVGASAGFNYLFVVSLLLSFAIHLIAGYLFVVRGLLYAMLFNFILGFKFMIIAYRY